MNTHRYIARIVLQAKTALFVGSGESSLLKDAIVQKDHLGLPMIQGSSLMGVLSHAFLSKYDLGIIDKEKEKAIKLWGYQFFGDELESYIKYYKREIDPKIDEAKIPKGYGSRLRMSSAYMQYKKDTVAEGEPTAEIEKVIEKFSELPARQHVKITDKGVATDKGLFNNEVVYAGTRFIFEMELIGNDGDNEIWKSIIEEIKKPTFRIGQGTRKGYGSMEVIKLAQRVYDLKKEDDFYDYTNFDNSLNAENVGLAYEPVINHGYSNVFKLKLTPDKYFIFGLGSGDREVDSKPIEENIVYYTDTEIEFQKKSLIPASSIKGALAHRVAFHFNKLNNFFAGNPEAKTGAENLAVIELFGLEAKNNEGRRGCVVIDDLYYSSNEIKNDKIFNHVAIDRFTGGAMDSALFSEKVSYFTDENAAIELNIHLEKSDFSEPTIINAFEEALK
ncbi:MAG: RAMP superfamily CRISPR-associated protein, partial [Spirosomaceae bacterium]|nr:RAMP superfamily CRISPR-associated protein [Spirosomataceae bacterium]